ncbi:MAG: hypothetical protein IT381_12065 [Deltaproteobacteria bacterium]|nr:hypothetical protein [Deltaproteobacteria bacterium]
MISFSQLKLAAAAEPMVKNLIAQAPQARKSEIETALVEAALSNGDRFLSFAEAKSATDVFTKAGLSDPGVTKALKELKTLVAETAASAGVSGISPHFTGQLEAKMIAELNAAVARAAGRPLDINMMIFEFQSDAIEQAIAGIAKANKNVTFRIIGDSTQSSNGGGNALPSLLKLGLANIQVKYKADFPYVWDKAKGRPQYSHGVTAGLNHHKGFSTLIDGMPDRVVTGSFNWSKTANEKNYENMVIVHAKDAGTRRAVELYNDEFVGYFNDSKATLSPNNFANFKARMTSDLAVKNGAAPLNRRPLTSDDYAAYAPAQDTKGFDLNGFRKLDSDRLEAIVGVAVAKAIAKERADFGRFASIADLKERVPGAAALAAAKLKELELWATLGSGTVSVNDASAEELLAAGVTNAAAIVRARETKGAFASLADAALAAGVSSATFASLHGVLVAQSLESFFNSRPFGAAVGGTGYGKITGSRTLAATMDPGKVSTTKASVTVAALDMFNRAKAGESIDVAMYGMNATSPESAALIAAAKRGVKVRLVLNDDFNGPVATALKAIGVDVRIQKARTMHEKFGVSGDDVFWGSANFSESSSTKHSEDRFALRGNPGFAQSFKAHFEELWTKSKPA